MLRKYMMFLIMLSVESELLKWNIHRLLYSWDDSAPNSWLAQCVLQGESSILSILFAYFDD